MIMSCIRIVRSSFCPRLGPLLGNLECLADVRVMKLLSEDPGNYPDAPREGIRRVLEEVGQPDPLIVLPTMCVSIIRRENMPRMLLRPATLDTSGRRYFSDRGAPLDIVRFQVSGKKHPRDVALDTSRIASIRMGTTVRCNRK